MSRHTYLYRYLFFIIIVLTRGKESIPSHYRFVSLRLVWGSTPWASRFHRYYIVKQWFHTEKTTHRHAPLQFLNKHNGSSPGGTKGEGRRIQPLTVSEVRIEKKRWRLSTLDAVWKAASLGQLLSNTPSILVRRVPRLPNVGLSRVALGTMRPYWCMLGNQYETSGKVVGRICRLFQGMFAFLRAKPQNTSR